MAPACFLRVAAALVAKTAMLIFHLSSSRFMCCNCCASTLRSGPTASIIDFHLATSFCFSTSMQIACFGHASLETRMRLFGWFDSREWSCSLYSSMACSVTGGGLAMCSFSPMIGWSRSHRSKADDVLSQDGMHCLRRTSQLYCCKHFVVFWF